MESFDNFEKIGNKTENSTLQNGKIKKKISWERGGEGGEKEGGGGAVKGQAGVEETQDLEQVHFSIIISIFIIIASVFIIIAFVFFIIHSYDYQGCVKQVSFQAPALQKPEVMIFIITNIDITMIMIFFPHTKKHDFLTGGLSIFFCPVFGDIERNLLVNLEMKYIRRQLKIYLENSGFPFNSHYKIFRM